MTLTLNRLKRKMRFRRQCNAVPWRRAARAETDSAVRVILIQAEGDGSSLPE